MGRHSYKPETRPVSALLSAEPHRSRAHHRGLLGRIAIRTGCALAALTATGVALFGASQVSELAHREPVPVGYDAANGSNEQLGAMLRESVNDVEDDFKHLLGALGAFTVLTAGGIALVARTASQHYYRRPEDEGRIVSVVDPFDFADEDDPDMPSLAPVEPRVMYTPYANHDRSLVDDLFGEPGLEESYA